MQVEPKVCVILPCHNAQNTIAATICSLADQTYSNIELIVCLDCPTDGTAQVLQASIAGSRLKTRIIVNEYNLGLGRTLNKLVTACPPDTKYIAIAEHDDLYYPNRIASQVAFLEQNQQIGLVSAIAEFWDGAQITGKFPGILVKGGQYPQDKLEACRYLYREQIKVVNSCAMIRLSCHLNNGLYFSQHFPNVSVDWCYMVRFALVAQIAGLNFPLVKLRREPRSPTQSSDRPKRFRAARELIQSLYWELGPQGYLRTEDYRYAKITQYLAEARWLFSQRDVRYLHRILQCLRIDWRDRRLPKLIGSDILRVVCSAIRLFNIRR